MTWVLLAVLAVAVIVVAVLAVRRSRPVDGVEQFQRQIDALSPEARRPVVDQVAQLDDDAETSEPASDPPPTANDGEPPEDPPRGS